LLLVTQTQQNIFYLPYKIYTEYSLFLIKIQKNSENYAED
jgi:hypothetical protein